MISYAITKNLYLGYQPFEKLLDTKNIGIQRLVEQDAKKSQQAFITIPNLYLENIFITNLSQSFEQIGKDNYQKITKTYANKL